MYLNQTQIPLRAVVKGTVQNNAVKRSIEHVYDFTALQQVSYPEFSEAFQVSIS